MKIIKYEISLFLDTMVNCMFLCWTAYLLCLEDGFQYKLTGGILIIAMVLLIYKITIEDAGFRLFRMIAHQEELNLETRHARFQWSESTNDLKANVEAIVAVGACGGFAVINTIVGNDLWNKDQDKHAGCSDELFNNGDSPPQEVGLYRFIGYTKTLGGDEWDHHGIYIALPLKFTT